MSKVKQLVLCFFLLIISRLLKLLIGLVFYIVLFLIHLHSLLNLAILNQIQYQTAEYDNILKAFYGFSVHRTLSLLANICYRLVPIELLQLQLFLFNKLGRLELTNQNVNNSKSNEDKIRLN